MPRRLPSPLLLAALLLAGIEREMAAAPESALPVLPQVVVTASAPSSDLAGAPSSRIDQDQLLNLGVTSPQDLSALTPNLATFDNGGRSLDSITSFRGLSNSLYFTDPAVVYYIDDVPSAAPAMNVFDPHSVSTLNFWEGSQEDQFGQNAPAGVIEVNRDAPQSTFGSTLFSSYGSYNARETSGEVTAPIPGSHVSILGSGSYSAQDGYLTNPLLGTHPDNREEEAGRLALRWTPSTPWTFDLNLTETSDSDGGQRLTPLKGPRYDLPASTDGTQNLENGLQSLRTVYEGDAVRTTFISSHRSYDLNPSISDLGFGGTPLISVLTAHEQQYTEELRVASKDEGPVSWQTGAMYEHLDFAGDSTLTESGFTSGTVVATDYDSAALFGKVTVKPTDPLSLSLGNRFQYDAKTIDRSSTSLFLGDSADSQQRTYLNFAPQAEASYAVAPGVKIFASSGLAFRPGGFAPFPLQNSTEIYASEQTWENEIGVGTQTPDRRLDTRLSLFWNQTYHYQLERDSYPNSDILNVPEVSSRGIEADVEFRPVPELTLHTSLGYTDATFVRFTDPTTGADQSGFHVPYVPRATYLAEATYRLGLSHWMAHADLRGLGDTNFDSANTPLYRQDAYALAGARIGYETPHWSAYLYGENLTDTHYDTLIDPGLNAQSPGDPRTFGIEADLRW